MYTVRENQVTAIKDAIAASRGNAQSEVMLVGFSLGGLDAQNIAEKSDLNVTTVVTYGTAILYSPTSKYQSIHMGAVGDPVNGLSVPLALSHNSEAGRTYAIRTSTYAYHSARWWDFDWEWDLHGDRNTYREVGRSFQGSSDVRYKDVKDNMAKFKGKIITTVK
jgi:pimeloyl-ACP methyl ester carboxylesterase